MFYSILFPTEKYDLQKHKQHEPDYFKDLCLDQIAAATVQTVNGFDLSPLFYTPVKEPDIILYRQEILRDLDEAKTSSLLMEFAATIREISRSMAVTKKNLLSPGGYRNHYLEKGRLLDYADRYCAAIQRFSAGIDDTLIHSRGINGFVDYLQKYTAGNAFTGLCGDIQTLREMLAKIKYCMLIKNGTLSVRKYEDQEDESEQILALFEKFKQEDGTDYRHQLQETPYAEHVEAAVLNMLASKWYPNVFAQLDRFCKDRMDFIDEIISAFASEVQFYFSWKEYIRCFQESDLSFCYPEICNSKDQIHCENAFDLALAKRLWPESKPVVNDFELKHPERVIVITGPNQGGKTTFARMFGQLHYLFSIGLSVPGSSAALAYFDTILTRFEREEDLSALNGKLQDDLVRLRQLFDNATQDSIIIVNEIFSSATLQDALLLGGRMMEWITGLDAYAVCVTFLDELAFYNEKTVSMMSTVYPDNPVERTFKIIRQPADGLAYAIHLAEKYNLTYERLSRRIHA